MFRELDFRFGFVTAVMAASMSAQSAWHPPEIITSARLARGAESVVLTFTGGRRWVARRGRIDDPYTFEAPRIVQGRQMAGWITLEFSGASYPYPVALNVYFRGVSHTVHCNYGLVYGWIIVSQTTVGLQCSFPHGPWSTHRELVALATGKLLAQVALAEDAEDAPKDAPAWAKGVYPE